MNSNKDTKSNKAKTVKESKPTFLTVFIDDFGSLVDESKSKYKVTLSGSYNWCFVGKCWRHEIKNIIPEIPLSYILSHIILTN